MSNKKNAKTMKASQINKSALFTEAWTTYKDHEGAISFSECLRISWNLAKGIITNGIDKDSSVAEVKEVVYNMSESNDFMYILTEVRNKSKGFQKDIAERGLNGNAISEKQAWCVAFEFKNVA